jgi:hypothetical protein
LDTSCQKSRRTMTERVSSALREQRDRGQTESTEGPGNSALGGAAIVHLD